MTRNITLRIDESIIKECRHVAVEENKSLSQWVVDTITQSLFRQGMHATKKKKALARLEKGLNLGGKPFNREDVYEK